MLLSHRSLTGNAKVKVKVQPLLRQRLQIYVKHLPFVHVIGNRSYSNGYNCTKLCLMGTFLTLQVTAFSWDTEVGCMG